MTLLLVGGRVTISCEMIKIPPHTTLIFFSNSTTSLDSTYNILQPTINHYNYNNYQEIASILPIWEYQENEMIEDMYINITNSLYGEYQVLQGLYRYPIDENIIRHVSLHTNYKEKEQLELSGMKNSLLNRNFSLTNLFNIIKKQNLQQVTKRVIFLLCCRKIEKNQEIIESDSESYL